MPAPVICPECQQSDQVAKVSTLYMEGIGLRKLPVQNKKGDSEKRFSTAVSDQELAKLVKWLSPPSSGRSATIRPVHPDWVIAAFTAVLPVFLFGIYQSQPSGLVPVLVILVFFYGLYFLRRKVLIDRYNHEQIKRQAQTRRVEIAIQKWMNLYYCSTDRGVFFPGQDRLVPVEEMLPYLMGQQQ